MGVFPPLTDMNPTVHAIFYDLLRHGWRHRKVYCIVNSIYLFSFHTDKPQNVAFLPVFGNDVAHGAPILYSATECRQGALCHGAIVKNVCAHKAIAVALVRLLELKASLHRNFHYAVKLLCFPHLFALGKLDNSLFISTQLSEVMEVKDVCFDQENSRMEAKRLLSFFRFAQGNFFLNFLNFLKFLELSTCETK